MSGFSRQLGACRAGRWNGRFALEVSEHTPAALVALGMRDLPMNMTARHALAVMSPGLSSTGSHGLGEELVASIPRLLERPCAVWASEAAGERVTALLEASDGARRPVVCVIQPGGSAIGRGGAHASNFILSAYGNRNAITGRLPSAARTGRLLMADPAAVCRLALRCGMELPREVADALGRRAAARVPEPPSPAARAIAAGDALAQAAAVAAELSTGSSYIQRSWSR